MQFKNRKKKINKLKLKEKEIAIRYNLFQKSLQTFFYFYFF